MTGSAVRIERGLILVLLIYKVVPRIFTRPLDVITDASGFPACGILKLSQWFDYFILVSSLDRHMYSQDEH
jgi:hypothetical protein